MGLAPQPPAFRGRGSKNNFCNLLVLGFSLVVVFSFRGFSFVTGIKISEVMTGKVQHVVVAIAMEAEANPFIEHLELVKDETIFPPQTPFLAYSGMHGDTKVTVVTNGKDHVYGTNVDNAGTVPAALATFLALQTLRPDLLINAGTCGGFQRKGAKVGDVYLVSAVSHHDRRIPIPHFDRYGIGRLETNLDVEKMAQLNDFKTGVCTTGNSLDKTEEDDKHMLANDATVKDMEAGAIAWSCRLHNVPFLGVKVVTDIVDGHRATAEEFMENLMTASKKLQAALPQVLEYVAGKHHHEL